MSILYPDESGVRSAFIDIFLDDCYGLTHVPIHDGGTIVDIGGNVGFFALAAKRQFPTAAVHVYEPNKALLSYLTYHADAVGFQVRTEAVGLEDGIVSLTSNGESVLVRTNLNDEGGISQVAFRSVIERVGGACELIKLDCEGAEWAILNDHAAWQNVHHLSMEYHLWASGFQHRDVPRILESIGFRVRRQIEAHYSYGIVWATNKRV